MYKILSIICYVLVPLTTYSAQINCKISKPLRPLLKLPKVYDYDNDLYNYHNTGFVAKGSPIIVSGKVKNQDCLPLGNIKVEMWHNDKQGYSYKSRKFDKYFSGYGVTYTNNLGEFSFITIKPKNNKVNIKISSNNNLLTKDWKSSLFLDDNFGIIKNKSIVFKNENNHQYNIDLFLKSKKLNIY